LIGLQKPEIPRVHCHAQSILIIMAIVSAAIYYGFILLVAFDKELLAKKLAPA
jgi:uncharacterized membrane protein (DUF485 family)